MREYLDAYHRALNNGFSEREAESMADDAYEDAMLSKAKHREPEPRLPECEFCECESVTSIGEFYACSKECGDKAEALSK